MQSNIFSLAGHACLHLLHMSLLTYCCSCHSYPLASAVGASRVWTDRLAATMYGSDFVFHFISGLIPPTLCKAFRWLFYVDWSVYCNIHVSCNTLVSLMFGIILITGSNHLYLFPDNKRQIPMGFEERLHLFWHGKQM